MGGLQVLGMATPTTPEGTLASQRHLFEIPEDVAYFNCASLAPQLRSVRAAGEAALTRNAQPWRTHSSDWFAGAEELRALFARLIRATADDIALIPATSYGLAVAAANLTARPRERILVIAEAYPSAVYTWRAFARRTGAEILTVQHEAGQGWTEAILEAIDERTKVVSVPNVHWTNGARIDLERVGQRAREVGAAFIVDASQSLGAMPLDVASLRPDYLVTVGYKWLLGPFSIGYMYVDPARHAGTPIEQNWILRAASDDFARLVDYRDEYQPGARRFDVGQRSNFTLIPMALAALRQVEQWSIASIARTLAALTARIAQETRKLGLATLSCDQRGPHILGIELPQETLAPATRTLADKGVYVGIRGSNIRISPHLYATTADIDHLIDALTPVARRGGSL